MMFSRSDQGVLLLKNSVVVYANPRAQKLLGFDPSDMSVVDLADYSFVNACFHQHSDEVTFYKNVWFQSRCLHVSCTEAEGYTLLFLYPQRAAQFTEAFFRDTLISLIAQVEVSNLPAARREMEVMVKSTLSASGTSYAVVDAHEFFTYTLSHFDVLSDAHLEIAPIALNGTMFLYPELMHMTVVWVILDLLKLAGHDGRVKVVCNSESDSISLAFEVQNAHLPEDLHALLFATPPKDPTEILIQHGNALFRAKQVFALHDSALEYRDFNDGFVISTRLSFAEIPPKLYAPFTALVNTWSVSPAEIKSFILGYFEEA